jgi:hypothetical protein
MPEPDLFFQATGSILGKVTFSADGQIATVKVSGRNYPLFYLPQRDGRRKFEAMKSQIKTTGNHELRLTVYPKAIHFPNPERPHEIVFNLVKFENQKNSAKAFKNFEHLEFKLSGLWQFIDVCKIPCISVYRNFSPQQLELVKKLSLPRKVKFMKALHLPLFWKDAPIPPFQYDPTLEKEERGKPMFVSIKAKFQPHKNAFKFDSLLAMPQAEAPEYFKAGKELKAEAMLALKGVGDEGDENHEDFGVSAQSNTQSNADTSLKLNSLV